MKDTKSFRKDGFKRIGNRWVKIYRWPKGYCILKKKLKERERIQKQKSHDGDDSPSCNHFYGLTGGFYGQFLYCHHCGKEINDRN